MSPTIMFLQKCFFLLFNVPFRLIVASTFISNFRVTDQILQNKLLNEFCVCHVLFLENYYALPTILSVLNEIYLNR